MNLPTSVVITGIDNLQVLDQAIEAARTFKPLGAEEIAALLGRTREAATKGQYELYKTAQHFDGTAHQPSVARIGKLFKKTREYTVYGRRSRS